MNVMDQCGEYTLQFSVGIRYHALRAYEIDTSGGAGPVISNKYQHPLYLCIYDVIMKHALEILNEHDFFEGVLHYDVIAAQV